MALSCIIFDCDGVILESVPVKTLAFARLAEPYGPEARDRMVLYHSLNGGVNRNRKFEWFFREILGREITPAEMDDWGRRFREMAFEEVCRCPLVPGIRETLDAWRGRLPLYVCSGAPQAELETILKARNLAPCFTSIHGAPPAKAQVLRHIVNAANADPAQCVMVGDASTDQRAAEEVGTLFYGRGDELKGGPWPWGPDLLGLNAWLEERWKE